MVKVARFIRFLITVFGSLRAESPRGSAKKSSIDAASAARPRMTVPRDTIRPSTAKHASIRRARAAASGSCHAAT